MVQPKFCACPFPCHCCVPVKEYWQCFDCVAGDHLTPTGERVKFEELRKAPHEHKTDQDQPDRESTVGKEPSGTAHPGPVARKTERGPA